MNIENLIGLEGGQGGTYWKVLAEVERGLTTYYPAVIDGQEKAYSEFSDFDEYLAHKVRRQRMTVRLLVAGNPIAAEEAVSAAIGWRCLATGPYTLDVYVEQPADGGELLTVEEAQALAASQGRSVAVESLRLAARRGWIEGAQKNGRDWLLPKGALLAYLAQERKPGPKPKA